MALGRMPLTATTKKRKLGRPSPKCRLVERTGVRGLRVVTARTSEDDLLEHPGTMAMIARLTLAGAAVPHDAVLEAGD
jgi:hypothetical protein